MTPVYVEGIGLLAAGLPGWADSLATLAGARPYQAGPVPDPIAGLLPPNERRRSSDVVRWSVHVAEEALKGTAIDPREVATVFASSGGEMTVLDRLCRALATRERIVSPTLFHHSVHNAAAGYWSIATGSQESSTALSCHDWSFGSGLLEAVTLVQANGRPVLLVVYDLPPPPPLFAAQPLSDGFAASFLLAPVTSPASLACCEVGFAGETGLGQGEGQETSAMHDPGLEALRMGNPAARSLPLLRAIAEGGTQRVRLEYLDDASLTVQVTACR